MQKEGHMFTRKRLYIAIAVVVVLLPSLASLLHLYTDWLFFRETGFNAVFTTMLTAKIAVGVGAGLLLLAFLLGNIFVALRQRFPQVELFRAMGNGLPFKPDDLARLAKPLGFVASLLLALLAGQWAAQQWQQVLFYGNVAMVGVTDPIFNKDLSFYLFQLPMLEFAKAYAGFALLAALALSTGIYYLHGGITISERGASVAVAVRRHLAVLAGLLLLTVAAGYYLDGFHLLQSGSGLNHGANYTDVHARLPVYRLLAVLMAGAAAVLAVGFWRGRWRLALGAPLIVLAIYGIGIKAYPALLQKFKVAPNELALEAPFIEHNIRFTRFGYNLDSIETVPFDVNSRLTAGDITANEATIRNIRLWDHAPLLRTYSQLQQIRTYYKFFDVDNDRYTVNGRYTQVMLSPRELSYGDLPSKSWINERLIFTHGNGLTIGPVSRISKEGLPEFFVKDIPAVSLADIKVTRPEIYYGEQSNDYVIVKSRVPEFSYPTATGNINTTYAGTGGVPLDSLARKVLFAARFKTEKLLLSSDITKESRILYNRTIGERVKTVAPFLSFDADPYMVVTAAGRLKWMIDAYTFSNRLPYAKPLAGGVNYLRNSVKVVVDAYDGSLDFYVSDPTDVMVRVYGRMFPTLFKPLAAMPEDLRTHVRYPHQLLQVQATMYASYHMTDPKVFYNKENLWEVPSLGEKQMEPYYTIMKLPGEKKEEYILLLPFTPSKRDNLAAWLTARCDEPNYGKLRAYTFPRDRLVYGPKQVDARINQDSYISQQLTLWNQRGSEVIRGSMLVIPIERSLLYVQPLYLAAADKAGLPELRRVIVAYGDQVVMEENLDLALQRLFGGQKRPEAASAAVPQAGPAVSQAQLAKEAMVVYEKAIALQRQGDWAGYGEELRKLREILQRLAK
jgi:uncharacterized protein